VIFSSSIKSRLVAVFLFTSAAIYASLGFYLYYNLKNIAIGAVDEHLHDEVQLIAGHIYGRDGRDSLAELADIAIGDYAEPLSGHYYQISDESGKVLESSPSLSIVGAALPFRLPSVEPELSFITGPDRKPHRLIEQRFVTPKGKSIIVQASESLTETYVLLSVFKRRTFLVLTVVFLLTAAAIYTAVGYALRGIGFFTREVGLITEKSLMRRIDTEGVSDELRPLAESFNTVLSRLETSFERQQRFVSETSHELRTPAAVIKSYCDVTLAKKRESAEYITALEGISNSVGRMSFMIDRILEVARLEAGILGMTRADVRVKDVIDDVFRLVGQKAEEEGVLLKLDADDSVVSADRERITEAFVNLVYNAIKYNRRGGYVDVAVRSDAKYCVVTVSDTGVGIDKASQQKIFDRFFRADGARSVADGTGLGLSIVKGIMDAHGAAISVESEEGKGTTFRVAFPRK